MLIAFAISNHRSIRDRLEVSLVAESKPTHDARLQLRVPGFDLEVVPVLAFVGANGSGKSNVLHALSYVSTAVGQSQTRWDSSAPPPRSPFVSKHGALRDPSRYELTFALEHAVFEYEFSVGPEFIEHERLAIATRGARSWAQLFERRTLDGGRVEIKYGRRLTGGRVAAEAATRANSLFLSSAAQNNHPQLTDVAQWIRRSLRRAALTESGAGSVGTAKRYREGDDAYRDRIRQFVASADLGIVDLAVKDVPIPEEQVEMMMRIISAMDVDGEVPSFEEFVLPQTTFRHAGDVGALDLDEESAGTRAWFEWAGPVLDALDGGHVLAADELDARLNSYLASLLVKSFQDSATNRNDAQLIFNAQDPALISASGLARDQLWVVEKDAAGNSTASPVTDFSARRNWDVGQAFRHGRFGGLPIVDEESLTSALWPNDIRPRSGAT